MQKCRERARNVESQPFLSMSVADFPFGPLYFFLLQAWSPSQRHENLAMGLGTVLKAWWFCQRRGVYAKGMEAMPEAWGPR